MRGSRAHPVQPAAGRLPRACARGSRAVALREVEERARTPHPPPDRSGVQAPPSPRPAARRGHLSVDPLTPGTPITARTRLRRHSPAGQASVAVRARPRSCGAVVTQFVTHRRPADKLAPLPRWPVSRPVRGSCGISSTWRSPTARRPGAALDAPQRTSRSSAPRVSRGSPRGGRRDAAPPPSARIAAPAGVVGHPGDLPARRGRCSWRT